MLAGQQSVRQLQLCDPAVFGDVVLSCQSLPMISCVTTFTTNTDATFAPSGPMCYQRRRLESATDKEASSPELQELEKRRTSALVDQLLVDIYTHSNLPTDYYSGTSGKSHRHFRIDAITQNNLVVKGSTELRSLIGLLQDHVGRIGSILVRQLKRRDALRRQREALCDVITVYLLERDQRNHDMRFSIAPIPGESGFSQWHSAMNMVVQLPEGIPPEFRCRLWLTLADRHLAARKINWTEVERNCFSEWSHPADAELGVQIVKDLHRTGCSLFCGEDGQENQALLKRVLLAYARWNKNVGYCQGFNMLAALILQVTEKCEADALKLMIYLIEGVLPDSYFADSLRGLSVDMAVFRELLRAHLPRLSKHLDNLQKLAKDGSTSYEPPVTNVFTMQWFLTLFCNCLPQEVVLRVWDLIFLEGNEILLRTALAIWQALADRIMSVRSADEFYCIMGVLTREMLEFGFVDANSLIKSVVAIGPLTELKGLREHYLYNINPWSSGPSSSSSNYEDEEKQLSIYPKEKLMLDIGVLKKQYSKLKQRQRQAHIIISAAVSRQPPRTTPIAMNHLLLGRSALVPVKRLGPPKGAIPPPRKPPSTIQWKDTERKSSSSSSDTELCDDPNKVSSEDEVEQLEEDNPTTSDKKLLMTTDNTVTSSADNTTADDLPFEGLPKETFEENEIKSNEGSIHSDDGFDFEKFLEERILCLKQSSVCSEESMSIDVSGEQDRVSNAKKNSERALEIIQENSLILHRILQCQSRFSPVHLTEEDEGNRESIPSPLIDINEVYDIGKQDTVNTEDFTFEEKSETCKSNNENILDSSQNVTDGASNLPIDDVYEHDIFIPGSKYKDILEYSKNLNEKYKALILDKSTVDDTVSSNLRNYSRPSDLTLPSYNLNTNVSSDVQKQKTPSPARSDITSLRISGLSLDTSPNKEIPEDNSRSPGHVYNPFPVRLSTRQNKDVAVKLGLYKK